MAVLSGHQVHPHDAVLDPLGPERQAHPPGAGRHRVVVEGDAAIFGDELLLQLQLGPSVRLTTATGIARTSKTK